MHRVTTTGKAISVHDNEYPCTCYWMSAENIDFPCDTKLTLRVDNYHAVTRLTDKLRCMPQNCREAHDVAESAIEWKIVGATT